MRWKGFGHVDAVIRAEGAAYLITSTSIRSLATVLYYRTTSCIFPRTNIYGSYNRKAPILTKECKTLGLGLF
jgi:hypothetical protein